MKSRTARIVFLLIVGALIATHAIEGGDALFVQVKQTPLRSAPSFLAPSTATLEYGTTVTYRASRGDWYEITRADGTEEAVGWVFSDAVEQDGSTEIVLQGERVERRTVTGREVALAGRGFSENLEQEYGDTNELPFDEVDAIEARAIDGGRIISFMETASLRRDFLEEVE